MKNGIYISPVAVRVAVGALTLAFVASIAVQMPEITRYVKAETM
ncbi:hypothetical protein JOF55_000223 [Haloactinomyces albus]|uniref:Uncharacterized protein n=1 Tax=Haloactinomyces albus TaxID=1352928 RepID=A0AAE4CLL1_9ACTN|nr:hypothetical protein [Haloactinomyces albus]